MNKNLITIIIPAYNEKKYIEKCLLSIKNQTYGPIELIVIDDGSTDNTRKIAKKYADILLTQQHQGPGTARNKAAKIAKGKILVFVDADMYLDKDYVKNIIKPIVEDKAIATFTKEEYVANPENIWSKCYSIDNNLPFNRRILEDHRDKNNIFRAILCEAFINSTMFSVNKGYRDDEMSEKYNIVPASGAMCFHYNPETPYDVFLSARWQGRSPEFSLNIQNIFKYSLLNSFFVSGKKIANGSPLRFILYKFVFDLGILNGLFSKSRKNNFAK